MDTGELIRLLADGCEPFGRCRAHGPERLEWLVVALLYVLLVVFVVSPRADLAAKIFDWRFRRRGKSPRWRPALPPPSLRLRPQIPGYSRKFLTLHLSIDLHLVRNLGSTPMFKTICGTGYGPVPVHWCCTPTGYCFPAIVLVGSVPAIAMIMMLRRSAALRFASHGGSWRAGGGCTWKLWRAPLFCPQDASSILLLAIRRRMPAFSPRPAARVAMC